ARGRCGPGAAPRGRRRLEMDAARKDILSLRAASHFPGGFNARAASFPFLIGVGTGQQIDRAALAAVGTHGRFPALLLDLLDLLQQLFLNLAVRVTRGLTSTTVHGPGFVLNKIQPTLRVERRLIDFAFVIDRSGSMNGSV